MKQFIFITSFLLAYSSFTAQTIEDLSFGTENTFEVMTWNIEHFPKNGQTTLYYVTQIIEALEVDLIAIQEVEDQDLFQLLTDDLSSYNGYLESLWFAGLAYLYNPDVIQINDIYEIYTSSIYWSAFPRSPMVMDLNFMEERIIIINNHFKCCGDGVLDINDLGDEETRRYNASLLLKEHIDINFPDENVIVLGDLNDNIADSPQNNVFQMFIEDSDNYLFADMEIALGNNSGWSFPSWPSHLDHILITNELFYEFNNENSEIQTIKIDEYLPGGWSEYDTNISDHRPVALKLFMEVNLGVNTHSIPEPVFSNIPNPFSKETLFSFEATNELKEIKIFNLLGQKVASLNVLDGQASILWNAEEFSSGIYFAQLISNNKIITTTKLVLIK
ncbi:MAG: hypothetical protein COB12_11610 [Flavobacterium sp.]|nr:MAG: hypothetical protein COB12_11610 [Flavobacterium sp.]